MATENSPLLHSEQKTETRDDKLQSNSVTIRIPSRKITVEPVLFFASLVQLSSEIVLQEFLLYKFEKEASHNHTHNSTDNATLACGMDPQDDSKTRAQSQASAYMSLLLFTQIVPEMLAVMFLIPYSDKAGRKVAIIPPLIGLIIKCITYLLVIFGGLSIYLLIPGCIIHAFFGGWTGIMNGCISYIADITTRENRAFRITVGIMISIFPNMFVLVFLGYLVNSLGFSFPIFIMLICLFIALFYASCCLQETVIANKKPTFITLVHIKSMVKLFSQSEGIRWQLLLLLGTVACWNFVNYGTGVWVFYLTNYPLCWSAVKVGYFTGIIVFAISIGGIASVKVLRVCLSDHWTAFTTGVIATASFVYIGFCTTNIMISLAPVFMLTIGGVAPIARAISTKYVSVEKQGALAGATAIMEVLVLDSGKAVFSALYSSTQEWMPGFSFLIMAGFLFLGTLLVCIYIIIYKRPQLASFSDVRVDAD